MNALEMAHMQGRLDGLSGLENNTRYRRRDKRLAYAQGYREGMMEKQQREARASAKDMSDDERQRIRDRLKALKATITN